MAETELHPNVADPRVTPEITEADVAEFVRQKWTDSTCPRCGTNEWATGDDDAIKSMLPTGADDVVSAFTAKVVPLYRLSCRNCGHVEFVIAKVVREWKRGRAPA